MILAFIDTETSGLELKEHEILQFGVKRVELKKDLSLVSIDKYEFNVKPKHIETASEYALKLNNYNKDAYAIDGRDASLLIRDVIKSADILVGQRLIFDLKFIKKMLNQHNIKIFFPKYIDTKQMASDAGERETSLDKLCKKYEIKYEGKAHTALADCERCYGVFKILLECSIPKTFTFANPYHQ